MIYLKEKETKALDWILILLQDLLDFNTVIKMLMPMRQMRLMYRKEIIGYEK